MFIAQVILGIQDNEMFENVLPECLIDIIKVN